MARETRSRSGRVSKFGMCVNEECEKYKEVQEITHGDFVCEKCQKPLTSCPPPVKKGGNAKLLAIVAGVVILLAILGAILFTGGSPKVEKLTLDKTSVTFKPSQSERLNVAIEPNEVQAELVWQSSDENVVKVHDGVLTANKAGKATIKVFVKEQEEISATCECIVVEKDVDAETIDIQEDPLILRPGGHQLMTVKCTPEDQNENIIWSSNDESIATVSPRGKVEALKVGEVLIIAKTERTGIADTAKVSVEGPAEAPEEKSAETSAPPAKPTATPTAKPATPASGSKNLGYATFKGSWPNDVNGRMIFKSSHIIDSKDPKGRVAEAGDYVIGQWSNGHLVQGIWYGSDNQVKGSIIIGK
jgi:hypothetical protein